MYSEIAANKRKTWLIMFLFVGVVGAIGWFLAEYWFQDSSFVIFILMMAMAYALFSYFGAAKMAIAVNGAKEITAKDEPRLWRTVENLSITNGMPMPKVYLIPDAAPNAFATGRDPNHAVVAATTGLVSMMNDSELEGVMAHEMGHVKNYDIRVSMIAFALVTVIALLSDILFRSMIFGGNKDRGGGAVQLVALAIWILAPISAVLLQLAISRKREYLADATGALTTRYPEGLASALKKIQQHGSALQRQNTSTAHLFFASPLKGQSFAKMFSSHPPVEDRIKRLNEMGNKL